MSAAKNLHKKARFWAKNAQKRVILVEATGFEPTTLWSRTIRATNCATPQNTAIIHIFCFLVN